MVVYFSAYISLIWRSNPITTLSTAVAITLYGVPSTVDRLSPTIQSTASIDKSIAALGSRNIITQVCVFRGAELTELETMFDHVHLLVGTGPPIWHPSSRQRDQGSVVSVACVIWFPRLFHRLAGAVGQTHTPQLSGKLSLQSAVPR